MFNFMIGFILGLILSQAPANYWPVILIGVAVYWCARLIIPFIKSGELKL